MKKVLLLLSNGFEIYEASVFIDVFGWNLIEGNKQTILNTAGLTKEVTTSFGQKVVADYTLTDIDLNDYDALAIPGGFEEFNFYDDGFSDSFQNTIKCFDSLNKPIASVCVASLLLGKSGILKNRNATTYNKDGGKRQGQLKTYGAIIIQKPIVIDKNVISSWDPSTAMAVAFELLEMLTSKEQKEFIMNKMGY